MNQCKHVNDCFKKNGINHFSFLRLISALFVVFTHSFSVLNVEDKEWLSVITDHQINFSFLGLGSFFIMSGFLVNHSLATSDSKINFLWKRFLRIYPPAIVCIIITAIVIGPLVTQESLHSYFSDSAFWKYLSNVSLLQIHYDLPGVFKQNMRSSVNASLWSLTLELKCYIALLLVFLISGRKIKYVLLFLVLIALAAQLGTLDKNNAVIVFMQKTIYFFPVLGYIAFFLIGSIIYQYGNFFRFSPALIICSFVGFFICSILHILFLSCFILLPVLVIGIGTNFPQIPSFFEKYDLSYSIYLYAYPVQQCMAQFFYPHITPFQIFCFSLLITIPISFFSWYFVEMKVKKWKYFFI